MNTLILNSMQISFYKKANKFLKEKKEILAKNR